MKKKIALILALAMTLSTPVYAMNNGNGNSKGHSNYKNFFHQLSIKNIKSVYYTGTITEIKDGTFTVASTDKNPTYDKVVFTIYRSTKFYHCKLDTIKVGDVVSVRYSSAVKESIPVQASAISVSLKKSVDEALKYQGSITNVVDGKDGKTITLSGDSKKWSYSEILFTVTKDTKLSKGTMDDLKVGAVVSVTYGPVITASYPPMAGALTLQFDKKAEQVVYEYEGTIKSAQWDGEYLLLNVVTDSSREVNKEIVFVISRDTKLMGCSMNQLKAGVEVELTYGPVMTKSIPPQTAAFSVEIDD